MRLAIVTPWFGKELAGGAERLAYELSLGLRDRGHDVTVFATCGGSFHAPWNADAHSAGESNADGISLLRFRLDRTNPHRFAEVNRKLLATPRERLRIGAPILEDRELAAFVNHNINSSAMLSHLARRDDEFDLLVFLPYLYGIVLRGWRIAPDRSVLVPCLHDEAYAYLPPVAAMMQGVASILFTSGGTFEIARRLYGPGIVPRSRVTGCGITRPRDVDAGDRAAIQGIVPEELRYVLYLGRRSNEKNVDLLVAAFQRYCEYRPGSQLRLILAGPDRPGRISTHPHVTVLHEVDEREKARLLQHCLALAQPSTNESFSRTMMEAWAVRRPVIVHAECLATATVLDATQAGWKARDFAEWVEALGRIDASSAEELDAIGMRASRYVDTYASWPRVLDAYESALAETVERRKIHGNGERRIVHVLTHAGYADAATILALQNDSLLKRNGFRSRVVAADADRRLGTLVGTSAEIREDDACIEYAATALRKFPLFVDGDAWNVEPSLEVLRPLQDGRTNLLAVAPIAPHYHQLEIALVFRWYYTLDFDARLLLVGNHVDGAYAEQLAATIAEAGLEHRVLVTGEVSRPALAAMYRSAHVFVSFRERYETGLSLLEAMAFDVPVCALGCPHAREILDGAGVVVAPGTEPLEIAGLWKVLASDVPIRERIIAGQRRRLDSAAEARVLAMLTSAAGAR